MKKDDALVLFKIIHALGFTLLVYMTPLSWENIYTNVNKDLDFLILFSQKVLTESWGKKNVLFSHLIV